MVDATILFRIGDTTYSGNDVPALVENACAQGTDAMHDLYVRLERVAVDVLAPRLGRFSVPLAEQDSPEHDDRRLSERFAFLANGRYTRELQDFYNGLNDLSERLIAHARLRSIDEQPAPARQPLVLYATAGGSAYRYRVSSSSPSAACGARQSLRISNDGLDLLLRRDTGCARYLLYPLPPGLSAHKDLVRLFLRRYVELKLRMHREGLTHYPLL